MKLLFFKHKKTMKITIDEMVAVLREEGYCPHKDDNGNIAFKSQNVVYTIGIMNNGFIYSRIYSHIDPENYLRVLEAAQFASFNLGGLKVLVVPTSGSVAFSVESVCLDQESFRIFVDKSMMVLSDALLFFFRKLQCLLSESPDSKTSDKEDANDSQIKLSIKLNEGRMPS